MEPDSGREKGNPRANEKEQKKKRMKSASNMSGTDFPSLLFSAEFFFPRAKGWTEEKKRIFSPEFL